MTDSIPASNPSSTLSSRRSSRRGSKSPLSLSLDFSNLPQLIKPSPPSNTLIVTELNDLVLFHPASLATIRHHIESIAPLNSFSPLKSFRRIVCSFYDVESAIKIRQHLDGTALLGENAPETRARVYFGEPTPLLDADGNGGMKHLEAPHSGKLFFISPPPSPPHGWEMRNEEPPNKEVHAADLADALAKLRTVTGRGNGSDEPVTPTSPTTTDAVPQMTVPAQNRPSSATSQDISQAQLSTGNDSRSRSRHRSRSSTLIFHPDAHGSSPHLPAVMVEDTTVDEDLDIQPQEEDNDVDMTDSPESKMMCHTARPPVELMQHA